QPAAIPVIGYLSGAAPEFSVNAVEAFRKGLSAADFVEGRNVTIEYRWGRDQNDRLPTLAAELVRDRVSVIAALGSTPAALAAKAAPTTIPIGFQIGTDPLAAGLIASYARPGGNITGVAGMNTELAAKRLELMRELVPAAGIMALLVNPTSAVISAA